MCSRSDNSAEPRAVVSNIQRYSLHDGGGIRTVVFLKGCPFCCPWCCNPENLSFEVEERFVSRLCIGCSKRADGRLAANGAPCDTRPHQCPTGAKELVGKHMTVDEVVAAILRDRVFYEESGGGMTLSGGECLAGAARQEFALRVLQACRAQGVSTAVETTLAMPLANAGQIASCCDRFLIDFKIADRARSLEITGIDTDLRDRNVAKVLALGASVVGRMPIIPGFTDMRENVRANIEALCRLSVRRVDILPFHQLGQSKYGSLGKGYSMRDVPQLSEQDVQWVLEACEAAGLVATMHG